jgi:hypothetical protein
MISVLGNIENMFSAVLARKHFRTKRFIAFVDQLHISSNFLIGRTHLSRGKDLRI